MEKLVKELTQPKFKTIQFNHILITTDYEGKGKESSIILPDETRSRALKEIQTVVAVGEHVVTKGLEVGAKVLIDVDKLYAKAPSSGKQMHLRTIAFNKYTGDIITGDNYQENPEKDREYYILITDREILMVL